MLRQVDWQGFRALVLEGPEVQAVVLPDLGGKIVSLRHPPSLREWLWLNHALPLALPEFGASYVARYDSGGWDELFPAVAAGAFPAAPWEGTPIPDHGELWGLPWRVGAASDDHIDLWASGIRFPILFTRRIALSTTGLTLAYRVQNPTPFAFPFLWSAHPLIPFNEGMILELDQEVTWREGTEPVALPGTLPGPWEGQARKLWTRTGTVRQLRLRDGSGALCLGFDPAQVSHLALWLNAGGWAGAEGASPYRNLGLEPSIGALDDLGRAVGAGEHGTIPPEGVLEWNLTIKLEG